MSKVTTWLTVVFDDACDEAWFTESLLDEERANVELARLHISTIPGKRERHLRYQLEQPLASEQLAGLTELKELGLFRNFYVVDEITAENVEK